MTPTALAGPRARHLFKRLLWRELAARYKGSVLGFGWSLLSPLLMAVVYTAVFSVVLRVPVANYPAFLLSGLLPWLWLTNAVTQAAASVLMNADLVRKTAFPLEILPTLYVASNLVHYLLSLPALVALLATIRVFPGPAWLALAPLVAATFLLAWGLGVLMAAATVFFRDVPYVLAVALTAWLYLTPVLYPLDLVPEAYRGLAMLNPAAGLIEGFRRVFLHQAMPDWGALAYSAAFAAALAALAAWVFARTKHAFHEVV